MTQRLLLEIEFLPGSEHDGARIEVVDDYDDDLREQLRESCESRRSLRLSWREASHDVLVISIIHAPDVARGRTQFPPKIILRANNPSL